MVIGYTTGYLSSKDEDYKSIEYKALVNQLWSVIKPAIENGFWTQVIINEIN